MTLDINDVAYFSKMDNKEILVIYYAGDCDTFKYTEVKKMNLNKVDILCRTEHLERDELNFILNKCGFINCINRISHLIISPKIID